MSANFSPSLEPYKVTGSFRFWCQKVLPLVYDDSLSYYELLCKVVNYLNDVISNVDGLKVDVDNLLNAFNELQDYVNNYFDNLDVQEEINNKLDDMATDGTLDEIINEHIFADLNNKITDVDNKIDTEINNLTLFIKRNYSKYYPSLQSAKENNFEYGDTFYTGGYFNENDGGTGVYVVKDVTDEIDNGKIVQVGDKKAICISEINNLMYGIFDGQTNTEQLQKLFNNEHIKLYEGVYYTSQQINVNHDISIECVGDVKIKGTDTSSMQDCVIKFGNDINGTEETLLTTNFTMGQNSLSVTPEIAGQVKPNDVLRISTSNKWLPDRDYYNEGQMLCIEDVTDNVLYFVEQTLTPYTNAKVQIIDSIIVNIRGKFTIETKKLNWRYACMLSEVKNSYFEDLTVVNTSESSYAALEMSDCYNILFNNLSCYQNRNNVEDTGYDYGLSISTSQNVKVSKCLLYGRRHGSAVGAGRMTNNIINRFININGSFSSGTNYSADFHGICEFCKYTGIAYNGVSMGGNNNKFEGTIYSAKTGYCVHLGEIKGYNFDFSNCTFIHNSTYNPFVSIVTNRNVTFGGVLNLSNSVLNAEADGGTIVLYMRKNKILAGGEKITVNLSNSCLMGASGGATNYYLYVDSGSGSETPISCVNASCMFPQTLTISGGNDIAVVIQPDGTKRA